MHNKIIESIKINWNSKTLEVKKYKNKKFKVWKSNDHFKVSYIFQYFTPNFNIALGLKVKIENQDK